MLANMANNKTQLKWVSAQIKKDEAQVNCTRREKTNNEVDEGLNEKKNEVENDICREGRKNHNLKIQLIQ